MKTFAMKVVWLLASLMILAIVPVGVQSTVQETPDAAQEEVEAASDAQRVRRIKNRFDEVGIGIRGEEPPQKAV